MTWVLTAFDLIRQRKLATAARVFGDDQPALTASMVTPSYGTNAGPSTDRWKCDELGHFYVPGDDGCLYCSEAD